MSTQTKPALAAERAVAVLTYLTINPRRSFSLLELSTALGVNGASLSSVLLALARAGFVTRSHRQKTYQLGPALVAMGRAAGVSHPVIDLARVEMQKLSHLGAERVGSAVVGDEIIILAVEGLPTVAMAEVRIGQRVPLLPPWGLVFLGWSTSAAVEEWLARLTPDERQLDVAVVEQSMAAARARGFTVGLDNPWVSEVQRLVLELAMFPGNSSLRSRLRNLVPEQGQGYWVNEIHPTEHYDVSNVAAPVFGPDGTVVFAITVQGIGAVTGHDLMRIGSELAASTRALTRHIGGHLPVDVGA